MVTPLMMCTCANKTRLALNVINNASNTKENDMRIFLPNINQCVCYPTMLYMKSGAKLREKSQTAKLDMKIHRFCPWFSCPYVTTKAAKMQKK